MFNVATSHPKGWQVGIMNYTKDTGGRKIGLINVNPSTTVDFMVYGGTSTKINGAVRFRNKSTYSILGMGTHFMGFDDDFSGALFYRLGQYFQLSPKFSLSGDIGYYHVNVFKKNSDEGPDRLFAMIGSLEWEFLGEIEPPALNDLIATTFGGICIGEITNRISKIFLNDSKRGWPRFWRELGATIFNPMGELKRFATGDAWKVKKDHYRYHDYHRNPVEISISAGDRYLADDGYLFKGEHNPYINFAMQYGDPVNENENNAPYDFFETELTFGLSSNQPMLNQIHLLGRL